MVRGLYQSSASMQYLIEKTDVIANNIANTTTNGFKRKGVFFRELIGAEQALERNQIHAMVAGDGHHFTRQRRVECEPNGQPWSAGGEVATYTDYSGGPLRSTGNPLDLALGDEGYFSVETSQGTGYTRDGQFKLDKDGFLVTSDGNRVNGEGGPIQITGSSVSVGTNGAVVVDGKEINRIAVRTFDEARQNHILNGMIHLPEGSDASPVLNPNVQQGFLESSNVSAVREMVEMIAAQRHYDADSRVIQTIDSTLQKSVNDIGRT
jgi:flagellar basal-body rod protein FlgF